MNKKEKIETYSKEAVDRVKRILESSTGSPYYYRIDVDGLKVVDRTSDLTKFDSYELFISDADELTIYIYASQVTPNYLLKRIFTMKENTQQVQQPLNGMELEGIIATKVNERVSHERERWDSAQLQKNFDETKAKLAEAESYIENLEGQLESYKSKKLHLGDINLGELASVVVEGMIRRNPKMLAQLPGGDALAGIIVKDNEEREQNLIGAEQGEATFKKKGSALTEEEQRYIRVIRQMEESFDEKELADVMNIIQHLANNTPDIVTVSELLEITKPKKENEKV